MAKPTEKSKAIDDAIKEVFGWDRKESIQEDVCVICGGSATDFKDNISRKEYSISGMCQNCQDEVFGG